MGLALGTVWLGTYWGAVACVSPASSSCEAGEEREAHSWPSGPMPKMGVWIGDGKDDKYGLCKPQTCSQLILSSGCPQRGG